MLALQQVNTPIKGLNDSFLHTQNFKIIIQETDFDISIGHGYARWFLFTTHGNDTITELDFFNH